MLSFSKLLVECLFLVVETHEDFMDDSGSQESQDSILAATSLSWVWVKPYLANVLGILFLLYNNTAVAGLKKINTAKLQDLIL